MATKLKEGSIGGWDCDGDGLKVVGLTLSGIRCLNFSTNHSIDASSSFFPHVNACRKSLIWGSKNPREIPPTQFQRPQSGCLGFLGVGEFICCCIGPYSEITIKGLMFFSFR